MGKYIPGVYTAIEAGLFTHAVTARAAIDGLVLLSVKRRAVSQDISPAKAVVDSVETAAHAEKVTAAAVIADMEGDECETLIHHFQDETGVPCVLVHPDRVSMLHYEAATASVPGLNSMCALIIGAEITKIIFAPESKRNECVLKIGAQSLIRDFVKNDPPYPGELENAIAAVEDEIARVLHEGLRGYRPFGTGGVVTSLALAAEGKRQYDEAVLKGYSFELPMVERVYDMLSPLPSRRIAELLNMDVFRPDILAAGSLILRELMHHMHFPALTVHNRTAAHACVEHMVRGDGFIS